MTDISMAGQRKRRAQWMVNRRQRLALGPVSDHGYEILQAIEIVKAKQEIQANPGGDFPEPKNGQRDSPSTPSFVSKRSSCPKQTVLQDHNADEVVIQTLQPLVTCQTLKLADLLTFDMGWTVKSINSLSEIGRGSYGRVLLARHRSSGVPLAIKFPSWSDNFASPGEMVNELKTIRTRATKEAMVHQLMSDSPFFPTFCGTLDFGNQLCQAVEFVGCKRTGTGYPLNSPPSSLSVRNVVQLAGDIVKGMMELHGHGLLHNDLKNDNVLLEKRDKLYNAVIIDFGLASTITAPMKLVGVPQAVKMAYVYGGEADYLAPEVVLHEQPTSIASDVYSIGRIFSDMVEIFQGHRSRLIRGLSKLGRQCMANDPDDRPSLDNIASQINKLQRPNNVRRIIRWVAKKLHLRRRK